MQGLMHAQGEEARDSQPHRAAACGGGRVRPVRRGIGPALGAALALMLGSGCATQGDFLRLQEQVADYHQPRKKEPDPFARIAQLSAEVDALKQQLAEVRGEVELARKQAGDALDEARRARTALVQDAPDALDEADVSPAEGAEAAALDPDAQAGAAIGGESATAPGRDAELVGYQEALDAWRSDDFEACIDRFTAFLQSYPTSGYADDAAYWLADCTYKNADFKRAVVRFNAVVSVYPESPKAPDALYRQGESLLKLGPKFHEAARTVFKRVQKDYPSSERAVEAAQQLDRLGPGADAAG